MLSPNCEHFSNEVQNTSEYFSVIRYLLVTLWSVTFTEALKAIIAKCVAGASVRDLCKAGDTCLEEELAKVYRKDKNIKKGLMLF